MSDEEPACAGPLAQLASCADELTTQGYDESGNLVEFVKPEGQPSGAHEGRKQLLTYDALNRLTKITQQLGASEALVTRYVYDRNDNLTHICTPRGQGPGGTDPQACEPAQEKDIEYVYDLRNRRISHIQHGGSAGTRTTTFGYDDEDNLTLVTDPKGQVQAYEYDDLDRRIGYCTPNAAAACQLAGVAGAYETQSIVFRYDGNDNLFEVVEAKRRPDGTTATETSTYVYDLFDRVDASTQRGCALDFDYDDNGNRIRVASSGAGGHATVYHYDERNRLARVELEADEPAVYKYYSDGRLKEVTYPNAATMRYGYAATGRVGSIRSEGAGGLLLAQHSYTYDRNANRIEQREELRLSGAVSQETTRYRYDATDRLAAFWVFGGSEPEKLTQYTYEGFNRRVERDGIPVATDPSDPTAFPAGLATPSLSRRYSYDDLEQLRRTGILEILFRRWRNSSTSRERSTAGRGALCCLPPARSGGSAVEVPPSCNWQTPGGELAAAFLRIGSTTCRLCSETDRNRSNCSEAPVGETAINCIRAAVCADETLTAPAKRMVGCLDNRHGTCNQGAEKSCDDGCLAFSAGDAHRRCDSDPNPGAAMARCGIDLTTSSMP